MVTAGCALPFSQKLAKGGGSKGYNIGLDRWIESYLDRLWMLTQKEKAAAAMEDFFYIREYQD